MKRPAGPLGTRLARYTMLTATVLASTGTALATQVHSAFAVPPCEITVAIEDSDYHDKKTGNTLREGQLGHDQTLAGFNYTGDCNSNLTAEVEWADGVQYETGDGRIGINYGAGSGYVYLIGRVHEEGAITINVEQNDDESDLGSATTDKDEYFRDALLHESCGIPLVSGATMTLRPEDAEFSDDDPYGTTSDYSATINWGDGTTSDGDIVTDENEWNVLGSHTYTKSGTYAVTVDVADEGGSTTTIDCIGLHVTAATAAASTTPPGLPKVGAVRGLSPDSPWPWAALLVVPALSLAGFVFRARRES